MIKLKFITVITFILATFSAKAGFDINVLSFENIQIIKND